LSQRLLCFGNVSDNLTDRLVGASFHVLYSVLSGCPINRGIQSGGEKEGTPRNG
jgi:hypothetical protein